MSAMISLLAYGKYLAVDHGNAGANFWEKEDKVMKLHGMRIIIDKVKSMVDRSITDAEDLLWDRLLWTEGANRFEMDINALEDGIRFRKRGSYFVTNRQNRLMSSWEEKTVMWMLASRRGRKMRQQDGSWHTRRVKEYLREVDKFRELPTVLHARHRCSARTWPGYSLTTLQEWSLARPKHFRAGWSRKERDLVSQNTVAVGCAEGGAPIHAMAGRAARDGVLELRAAAHGLYIPTFNRRCMETKEVGRKQVGCAMVRSPRP
jgi:hypothetical protein